MDINQMTSKGKKEVADNEDIRQKTLSLIEECIIKKLSKDIASRIEDGIETSSKNENDDFNVMLYTILTTKVLQNLKNPFVINSIKNGTWKPEDLASLEKDILNPEKWQQLQDTRLPKNVKKEKVKGLNKCPRCKSWYTTCTGSAQLRSADEPMTSFILCEDCDFRFKM
jgi:DNA-directed RNA polymerase subunit M/transcription elongation factor TFIIS